MGGGGGVGLGVGVGGGSGVGVGVGRDIGVNVGSGVGVAVGAEVGVDITAVANEAQTPGVGAGVGVGLRVGVAAGHGVGVDVGLWANAGVAVGGDPTVVRLPAVGSCLVLESSSPLEIIQIAPAPITAAKITKTISGIKQPPGRRILRRSGGSWPDRLPAPRHRQQVHAGGCSPYQLGLPIAYPPPTPAAPPVLTPFRPASASRCGRLPPAHLPLAHPREFPAGCSWRTSPSPHSPSPAPHSR